MYIIILLLNVSAFNENFFEKVLCEWKKCQTLIFSYLAGSWKIKEQKNG